MSAFTEWWESQLRSGESVANPEEMLAAMVEAFRDVAKLGYDAGLEAAAKACEEHGDTATAYLIRAMIEKP